MARVKWAYPIEELHGKLAKGFGAAQRASKNAKGKNDPFTVHYGVRTKPVTENEQANRDKFAAVRALVETHKNDPTKRQQDQAGFKAQTAIKTMNAYLWAVCKAEYEAAE
ncbi:MAG: hypothetical protein KBS40_03165 [Bacteroidales bacterium]|nr:hypothetical protein [Bacteroidales bacterium]